MTASTSIPASSSAERAAARNVVLLVAFPDNEAAWIHGASQLEAEILVAADEATALALLEKRPIDVLCLGGGLHAEAARRFLDQLIGPASPGEAGDRPVNVVLAAGPRLEIFQDLVDRDCLYYLTQKPPAPADVVSILESAVEHQRRREAPASGKDDDERDLAVHRILRLTEPLAREADLTAAVARAIKAVEQLIYAESARILLYDPATETLWSPARLDSDQRFGQKSEEEESRESAAAGVVSFAVRTRRTVRLERVGEDPRYDADADTAGGPPDQRFLAAPVIDPAGRRVWAVLVGLRSAEREAFSATDAEHLELFAEQVAPLLGRLLQQAELEERASQRHGIGGEAAQIFRGEALEYHMQGFENQGHVLEVSPSWTRWAYRLLLGIVVVALVFSLVIPIHEYAAGIAVVRLEGRTDVTSSLSGTVVAVEVEPGRRVAAGDLLVRLYGAQEAAELERIERELELELVNRLRNPADLSAERALGALRAQKRLAEQRLEERSIRAPRAGVVSDVWVQAGQLLTPGQVVLALEHQDPKLGIVALLPGQYRPLLEPGQTLRLELEGYRYAYQHLEIAAIGDEVVGPTEARRALGAGIADAVPITGPVVFVYADLLERTFESDGRVYAYHDGILGTAEVRIRSEPILLTLVPGLKVVPGIDLLVRDEGRTAMNEESR